MQTGTAEVASHSVANFTKVLRAAFTLADPKSKKKLLELTVFFCAFVIFERK